MDPKLAGLLIAVQALGTVVAECDPQIARRLKEIADRYDSEADTAPKREGAEYAADILRSMLTAETP